MNQGWSCPGCGKCYSPTTPQCFTCGQPTYATNTTGMFKAEFTLPEEKACKKKNCEVYAGGYCAKCHSEYY